MWHIFHPEVSARGGMATPFIQAQWGPSVGIWRPDGICMPLVCSWLAGQEHGRDFVAQPHDNAFIQAVRRLAMNFYSSQHTWDSNYPDVALAPLGLALQNLRMVRPRTGMPVPDADFAGEMRDYLLYEPPARYFVGFTGYCGATSNQILTHTIGVDTVQCMLFDPNVGRAWFPGNVRAVAEFAERWINLCYRVTSPHLIVRRYEPAASAANRPRAPSTYQWAPGYRG